MKGVIFDLDGTTLNTLDDLALAVNHALRALHLPLRTIDEVRGFAGNGVRKLIERAVMHGEEGESAREKEKYIEAAYKEFSAYYAIHCTDNTLPYKGITDALKTLKERGIKRAVVSNKDDYAVKELVKDILPGLFDYAIGVTDKIRAKPAPDSALQALKALFPDCSIEESKKECIYVGDSEVDIETAHNAGVHCISVTWGFKTRDFLLSHGAEIIVDDTSEMLEKILGA